jgi:peptide subunit release factor 1 (eRF1)
MVDTQLDELLHRLARVQPPPAPVISLYLNTQADERGRDRFSRFVRDELRDRVRGFRGHSGIKPSLERDVARIEEYLRTELRRETNGVAIFACSACGLFEALQLEAPFPRHQLHLSAVPHLYPLALVSDQFPRFAALVADTNTARILVFALNTRVDGAIIENEKTRRTSGSGWEQARFQRHIDQHRLQHAKEVVARLEEIVRTDDIRRIVVGGDEVIVPMLRSHFTPHLASLIVETLPIDMNASDQVVLQRALEAVRQNDAKSDQAIVEQAFDGHRAGGLGVVGVDETRAALKLGQVHVLLLAAATRPDGFTEEPAAPKRQHASAAAVDGNGASGGVPARVIGEEQSNELLALARQTDAEIRFIEDPDLLKHVGGVAALLRFRVGAPGTATASGMATA